MFFQCGGDLLSGERRLADVLFAQRVSIPLAVKEEPDVPIDRSIDLVHLSPESCWTKFGDPNLTQTRFELRC